MQGCNAEEAAKWHSLRDALRSKAPAFGSRAPFVLTREDFAFMQEVTANLEQMNMAAVALPSLEQMFGANSEEGWSDCALGSLTVRVFMIMTQLSVPPEEAPRAMSDLLAAIVAAPWTRLMLHGWPVFTLLGTLAKWATPHVREEDLVNAPGGVTARSAAQDLVAQTVCDAMDGDVVVAARRKLGEAWRRHDPPPSELPSVQRAGCPLGQSASLVSEAALRLVHGSSLGAADFAPELLVEARGLLAEWFAQARDVDVGLEAWTTEWPIWVILGRFQRRLDLLTAFSVKNDSSRKADRYRSMNPLPSWISTLQQAIGFDDTELELAFKDLAHVAAESTKDGGRAFPKELSDKVRCTNQRQCSGELFARLHVLLHDSGRLPLRDAIFIGRGDTLSRLHLERSQRLSTGSEADDWQVIMDESKSYDSFSAERSRELDHLMPIAHPLQADRRQLANFALMVREELAAQPLSRCMEWDQPFLLVRVYKGLCRWTDVFSYSEPDPDQPMMGLPGRHEYTYGTRHYWGDLSHPDRLGIEPDTFDLVICPFVFEHVAQPFVAMQNLARVLRPGGFILWAAPFIQQYHGSPHDYYRYTPKGARALAEDAGLEVVRLYAPGDLALATGVLSGMMLPYWSEERMLSEAEPAPGDDSPKHPLNVFMLIRKPL
eukprot:TRINITY_DN8938_c0_g2_i1.p1 TRINITY_DN8938_c0_g2~~TRINITY_DN8938_c0_g2_i1.p1  ORF type:complete len:711 (+),score=88.37 TRINITY_DN8938_c0_g2_i1:156-2135(+)